MKDNKESLVKWLSELDDNVLKLAVLYAQNYFIYGFDITEKLDTAVQQQSLLATARRCGFVEGQERIIHCRECKYWQDNNNGYPHEECRWNHDETPDENDFCSFAERMEGIKEYD